MDEVMKEVKLLTPAESLDRFMEYVKSMPYKQNLVNTINTILCISYQDPKQMMYTACDLKIALERLEILDICRIYIEPEHFQLRLLLLHEEDFEQRELEEYLNERRTTGSTP